MNRASGAAAVAEVGVLEMRAKWSNVSATAERRLTHSWSKVARQCSPHPGMGGRRDTEPSPTWSFFLSADREAGKL